MGQLKHPNAVASGSSSTAGVLLIYVLGLVGLTLTPVVAAAAVGALGTLTLLIGREGMRGILRTIWKGSKEEENA